DAGHARDATEQRVFLGAEVGGAMGGQLVEVEGDANLVRTGVGADLGWGAPLGAALNVAGQPPEPPGQLQRPAALGCLEGVEVAIAGEGLGGLEQPFDQAADEGIHHRPAACAGSGEDTVPSAPLGATRTWTSNTVPSGPVRSQRSPPPCASRICLLRASPRPVPWGLAVNSGSKRRPWA